MSNLPVICICKAEVVDAVNAVWAAMGRGEGSFTRRVCADVPGVDEETAPTHWLMSDAGADESDVYAWQRLAHGDLPPLGEGFVWGEEGCISAAEAVAATSAENLQVYSASGDVAPTVHVAGILAGLGLRYVPDPS